MIEFALNFTVVALLTFIAVGVGRAAGNKIADRLIRFADPRIRQREKKSKRD